MTYAQAIDYLYNLRWFGAKLGLNNTLKLAGLAGHPEARLRFIHVAGTNGKGSTCAMLESIYRAAGLRVGLFTSPHLVVFGERLQVNRRLITEAQIVRLVEQMRLLLKQGWPAAERAEQVSSAAHHTTGSAAQHPVATEHPTFFEVVTVMALSYFAEQACDLVIWETGLGGRLDATNIVTPLVSVITNIHYDHQQWLGNTLPSIAAEKAGIIKPGVPIVTATSSPEALTVIEQRAREQNAPLTLVSDADLSRPPLRRLHLPLSGVHQRVNAALAIATVRALADRIPFCDDALVAGLSNVQWPGRLQLITQSSGRQILLDGAHNLGGAEVLAVALKERGFAARFLERPALPPQVPGGSPASRPLTLILGILQDKDWAGMCQLLAPLASRILLVPVSSERRAGPQDLARVCRLANSRSQVLEFPHLGQALTDAGADPFVVVAGSLYLVGEALELLVPPKIPSERVLNEYQCASLAPPR